MATVLKEEIMIRVGGLEFREGGDGGVTITVCDGSAENAPPVRMVVVSAETWAAVADIGKSSKEIAAEEASELVDSLTEIVSEDEPKTEETSTDEISETDEE